MTSFSILDRELPKFTYCPSDLPTTTSSASDTSKRVNWDQPSYSDNSGSVKLIYNSHQNPSTFPIGPANKIEYTIEDSSSNRATCEFFVKVERRCFCLSLSQVLRLQRNHTAIYLI